jgi:ABC-type transport system substrate-binding protein
LVFQSSTKTISESAFIWYLSLIKNHFRDFHFPLNKTLLSLLTILLLTGCAPQTDAPLPTLPAAEIASPVPPADVSLPPLRYAILAPTTSVNLWSLFDEEGASYENYAVQGEYYPRLYHLAPPNNELTPLLVDGFPSPIVEEGEYFTATVTLLPNLVWSDDTPLTTEDVAFTINTALEFELGLNWAEFYNKEKLDHVEVVDTQTIKYFFLQPPSAGDWQHGALIGVFANQAYWQEKIIEAKNLLPLAEDDLLMAEYQTQIDALDTEATIIFEYMQTLKEKTSEYRGQNQLLIDRKFRRDSFKKKLELAQRKKREKLAIARAALYALDDANEPRAGFWQLSKENPFVENTALTTSHFENARYTLHSRDTALQALLANGVDFMLSRQGLTATEIEELSTDPAIDFIENRRNDIRFLLFNTKNSYLDDIALRRALFCLIDPEFLANTKLDGAVAPAFGWIHPENIGWYPGKIEPPCADMDADARLAAGMRTLKMAGYVWEQEPSPNHVGSGLKLPSGENFPSITLLAPREDPSRIAAASYIEELAGQLGVPLKTEIIPADDLFFTVYGVADYDLAIVGWSLSLYPDYLCDFFAEENPYNYSNVAVQSKCAQFLETSNLEQAREQLFEIEVLLWDNLPALPLFSSKITEAYRNITLPFESYLGGIAHALYGAPTLLAPEDK